MIAAMGVTELVGVLIGLLVAGVTGFIYMKSNVSKVWQTTAEGFKARVGLLEEELGRAKEEIVTLKQSIATLQGRTDLSAFETRAGEYHRELVTLLSTIATEIRTLSGATSAAAIASAQAVSAAASAAATASASADMAAAAAATAVKAAAAKAETAVAVAAEVARAADDRAKGGG